MGKKLSVVKLPNCFDLLWWFISTFDPSISKQRENPSSCEKVLLKNSQNVCSILLFSLSISFEGDIVLEMMTFLAPLHRKWSKIKS